MIYTNEDQLAAGAGIDGINLHGYTSGQTFNYTRFADRKQELLQSVQQYASDLRDQEPPILMGFV